MHAADAQDLGYNAAMEHARRFVCPVVVASPNETVAPPTTPGPKSGPSSTSGSEAAGGSQYDVNDQPWTGFQDLPDWYNDAWASWNVPSVTAYSQSLNGYSVIWPGVGSGSGTGDELIQAGTKQYAYVTGGYTYGFWYEIYPKQSLQNISSLWVTHGQNVYADVSYSGTTAYFYVENTTTGDYTNLSETFNGNSGAYAEWIVERPTIDGSLSHLANWAGAITFTGARSWDTTTATDPCVGDLTRDRYIMYDGSTKQAHPSGLANYSYCGFDVTRD